VRARRQLSVGDCDRQAFPKGFREAVVKHTARISSILGARSARWGAALGLTLASVAVGGCGSETMRQGTGSSYLIINHLGADDDGVALRSDVLTKGGVLEDNGVVEMTAAMKDVTNPAGPTTNNAITVSRYRVTYRRSDGRNTPGVDVPHAFDGARTFTVSPGDTVEIPFVLVRVQAKLEAPLSALAGGGGAVVISTLADVTFYGRDQTGRETSITGTISVNFADWADPES
jgi:hypothetical protein